MIKTEKEKGKLKKFMQGKGFYGVLAVCVFAVGIASFAAIENIDVPLSDPNNTISHGGYVVSDEQAGIAVSNIPKEDETEPETDEPTEEPTQQTQAPQEEDEPEDEDTNPATSTVKPYEGFFMMPLSTEITKDFSAGELVYSETMRDWRTHNGIDFKAEKTSQVTAINDGTVKTVLNDPLWGSIIEIDHGGGIIARYCGVTPAPSVQEGAQIQMGQEIGTLSEIPVESVEQLHLHFEIFVDGTIEDPMKAMNKLENE